jgi:6-phospho 3-hexuloisomerase
VFVVGETTTPAVQKKDLLLAVSGSGETSSTVLITKAAKKQHALIAVITSHKNSTLGRLADTIVRIKGRSMRNQDFDYLARQLVGGHEPLAPLGTLFELTTMFFLDCIISELMVLLKTRESYLKAKHANLE